MDRVDIDPRQNERALRDLDRSTRWLFGLWPLRRALAGRLRAGMRLVDVGGGSGLAASELRRRLPGVAAAAVDLRLRHLVLGRSLEPAVWRVVADARQLPFSDRSFDWSCSNLLFHHFDGEDNRRVLAEMRRVGRRGAVVTDLRKVAGSRWLGGLFFALLRLGEVARHDGLLSFERAWSLDAVRRWLGETAPPYELRRRFPLRFTLVLEGAEERD